MTEQAQARCSKCGAQNAATTKLCGSCGAKFVPVAEAVSAGEDGLCFCYRHSKEPTRVTCGRCERPICPKCLIVGPAGVRCKVCASGRTPVRWRGLAHNASMGVRGLDTRKVWYLWIWASIIRFIAGLFGRW
ncbi:MAG: hypothetical protein H7Y17_00490 [Chlorobia bacterium]|nr:hypothetical protein [Fimbriimonadaceae bacterium]